MKIVYKDIYLRDEIAEDNWDCLRWNRVETDWRAWNLPWVEQPVLTEEKIRKDVAEFVPLAEDAKRRAFEVCLADGRHVGFVGSYHLDGDQLRRSLGIAIPEHTLWHHGIGTQAFAAFIRYWRETEPETMLFTETWSGNYLMLGLAAKCGFEEVGRTPDIYQKDGISYDSVLFRLNWDKFDKAGL